MKCLLGAFTEMMSFNFDRWKLRWARQSPQWVQVHGHSLRVRLDARQSGEKPHDQPGFPGIQCPTTLSANTPTRLADHKRRWATLKQSRTRTDAHPWTYAGSPIPSAKTHIARVSVTRLSVFSYPTADFTCSALSAKRG